MTLAECVAAGRARLLAAGLAAEEAALDARLLAQHTLDWDTTRYLTEAAAPASQEFIDRYEKAISRRALREPLAYIVGRRDFWSLAFEVGRGVLVPRPETEMIVEAVLEWYGDRGPRLRVCDVGTGSGCLAVVVAREFPHAQVVATDSSPEALAIADRNVRRHGLTDRIELVGADLFAPSRGPFDLIISNPPYVPDGDREGLQPEVRDFEPAEALFGGPDGLSVIRRLVKGAASQLQPGGCLVFEIGAAQAQSVRELISGTAGLTMTTIRRDLQGIPRTVIARRE